MSAARPLVSVIVPVFNAERFLAEAVESIRGQGYHPLEVLVVDDGSTDRSPAIAEGLGGNTRYVRQSNRGPAAARNTGLALARGEFVAFLDADDLWPPGKLQDQVARLLEAPSVDVVLGRVARVGSPGDSLVDVHLGSGVFRRSVFDAVGLFDETLRFSEDHDWFLRGRERGIGILILDRVTLLYRRHENNMTLRRDAAGFQLPWVLKRSLDRRRSHNSGRAYSLPKLRAFIETNSAHGPSSSPTVSVVIPVYNGERYLAEAIDSVLAQTPRPDQVIVVDDGSTDGSGEVAKAFGAPVEYLFQPNAGTGAARNRGVSLAMGSYLAFLDQDDVWLPDKLSRQMRAFQEWPRPDAVFGHVRQFHSPERAERRPRTPRGPKDSVPGYSPSAMLIRREAFFRVGPFGMRWRVAEWADWYVRAVDEGLRLVMIPDVVALRRLHERNKGLVERETLREYARLLKASLDRRRRFGALPARAQRGEEPGRPLESLAAHDEVNVRRHG